MTTRERNRIQDPRFGRPYSTVNLLLRKAKQKNSKQLIQNNGINDSNAFRKPIEYGRFERFDIYIYRSPIHSMVKLFEINRDAFYKLQDYYNIMATKNPGVLCHW
jgi:hypothetical protein